MKLRSAHFWIAVLSLVAVVGMAVVDLRRTAPGELTRVHARVEKLDGGSNCSECHGGIFSDMTESCLECHETIAQHIATSKGLHGTLAKGVAQQCSSCHSEHHGAGFEIVNRQSFVQAGIDDPKLFDHERVGWNMSGGHLALDCAQCHVNAFVPLLPESGVRYLGLEQNCASCHEDVHEGMMRDSCASCHGQEKWDVLHADGHEKKLELIGGHGDLDCRACHEKGGAHALEAMDKRLAPIAPRTCVECHPSPHTPTFVEKNASLTAMAVEKGCIACHAAAHESFRDPLLELTKEQHAWSGFSLDLPHDVQKCEQCHDPALELFEKRYPGREPDRCSACHADPHGGQFAQGAFSSGDCLACHERTHFEPNNFDLEKHQRSDFPLSGAHTSTECNRCHVDPIPPETPRKFRGTGSTCEACHPDVHAPSFQARSATLAPLSAGDCARCHDTQRFANLPAGGFDHGHWTDFAIEGAHAQAGCETCHIPRETRAADGRQFGRIEEHFERYQGCVSCHNDPHVGIFDGPRFPKMVDGKEDCARCHDSVSFRTLWDGFDHGRWTGFDLRQGHQSASCSACHTPRAHPDANGRSWQPALGTGCGDCHDNPHGEQFAKSGATDCGECHAANARNFSTFDHERDSKFALGETHRNVACAKCHLQEAPRGVKNAVAVIRYKPLGTECADCHGVHDDVLLRRKPGIK